MDKFAGIMPFVRTADLGSFVAAGKTLGLSASAVGKAVARLEQQVGIRLIQRSTRNLKLTEEGRVFLERCRCVLDELDDAYAAVSHSLERPKGRLHISVPIVTYHLLLPIMPEFAETYPEIELDFDFNDQIVDLIDHGVDIAIRTGELPDSRFTTKALRPFQQILCASPAYLARRGVPTRAEDLFDHKAVRFRYPNTGKLQEWPIPEELDQKIGTGMTCNNMEALLDATRRGLGIGSVTDFLAREAVHDGTLKVVLPECVSKPRQLSLLWPSNRNLSPKVRVFVDYVSKRLFAERCEFSAK